MALLIFVLGIAVGFPAATLGVGFLVDNAVPMLGALMAVPVIVLAITGALFAYCWVEDIPEMVRCPRGRLATNEMMRLCHLPGNVTVSAPSSRSYPGLQEHDALQRPWPAGNVWLTATRMPPLVIASNRTVAAASNSPRSAM